MPGDMFDFDNERDQAIWDVPTSNRRDIDQWETAYSPAADLLDLLERMTPAWMHRGACKGSGELFFPTRGESMEDARKVCRGCPVKTECLEYALEERIKHGVWGGLSEQERRAIRSQRDSAGDRCGTWGGYYVHVRKKEKACEACIQAREEGAANPRMSDPRTLSDRAFRAARERKALRARGVCPACAERNHDRCHKPTVDCLCPHCLEGAA